MKNNIELWKADEVTVIPNTDTTITAIVNHSDQTNLSTVQKQQIALAYNAGAYDMAAEYVWKKTVTKLREAILSLGEDFVGEMLLGAGGDKDIRLEDLLTDYKSINLAEQLGMISKGSALLLRQDYELIQYCFSTQAIEDNLGLDSLRVLSIIKDCVENILSKPNMQVALEFTQLRERLLNDDIREQDVEVNQLKLSSLFFIRTVCTVLSSAIRTRQGALLEHPLNNFKLIIPLVWEKLADDDKWNIGFLYRDVVSAGNTKAANAVKLALAKNNGFDYVPESLRSRTFIKIAQQLIDVHYGYDNFYREPKVVEELASLGSVLPEPALFYCMKAYLLVYLGNYYGRSDKAVERVEEQLAKIDKEQWIAFFDQKLPYDIDLINTLCANSKKPIMNFKTLLRNLRMNALTLNTTVGAKLYSAILNSNISIISLYQHK